MAFIVGFAKPKTNSFFAKPNPGQCPTVTMLASERTELFSLQNLSENHKSRKVWIYARAWLLKRLIAYPLDKAVITICIQFFLKR